MKTGNGIVIRKAVKEDCPQLLDLIKELADFLKVADEIKIDLNDLEKDGFDEEHPFYYCIVAEDPNEKTADGRGKLVGYLVYLLLHGTWSGRYMQLEDIYVTQNYRSKQIGSALFGLMNKIGLERGCREIEWIVADWNTSAQKFYERKGAVNVSKTNQFLTYKFTEEAMSNLSQDSNGCNTIRANDYTQNEKLSFKNASIEGV